jgi:Type VI secretion system/phage-baseplate injector OB domain
MSLTGTYAGIVESNRDPEKLGRLKVRVPHVYGATGGGTGYIGVNDLPWALPAGMPAGGSAASGGFSQLPEPGDKVWVRFLDGEPEKPIWEWAMQTVSDRDGLTLHTYDESSGTVGKPNRTIWTRYGHAVTLNEGGAILSTSQGYRLLLTDASEPGANDGTINLTTALGNFLTLDDSDNSGTLNINEDLNVNVGSGVTGQSNSFDWTTASDDFSVLSGGKISLSATDDVDVTTASAFSIDALSTVSISAEATMTFDFTTLLLGTGAVEPFVLGLQFQTWAEALLLYLSVHTHTSTTPGAPTSPPIIPPTASVQPETSLLLSKTIFGS